MEELRKKFLKNLTDYDGHGYYAKDNKVYELYASPRMIRNGFVRNEFTHVCWYNK